jgi:hypothetical protein
MAVTLPISYKWMREERRMCVLDSSAFTLVQGYGSTFPAAPRGEDEGRNRGSSEKVHDNSRWIMLSSETFATPTPTTPRCTHTLANHDIPCGRAIAVIQRFRPLAPSPQRNPRGYIPYNLAIAAMVATYSQSLPPIDVGTLHTPPGDSALWECRPPLFKKAKGRPQTARLTAGEQRGRRAAWRGLYLRSRSGAVEV